MRINLPASSISAGQEAYPALTWLAAEHCDSRCDAQHLSASWTARREHPPPREATHRPRGTSAELIASDYGEAARNSVAEEHGADQRRQGYLTSEPASPAGDDARGRPYATDNSLQVPGVLARGGLCRGLHPSGWLRWCRSIRIKRQGACAGVFDEDHDPRGSANAANVGETTGAAPWLI